MFPQSLRRVFLIIFAVLYLGLLPAVFAETKDTTVCTQDSDCFLDMSCIGCNRCVNISAMDASGIDCLAICNKDETIACTCLEKQCTKKKKDKEALILLLKENPYQAARALSELNDPSVIEALARSLNEAPLVCVASALGKLKDKRGIDYLISALAGSDPSAKSEAAIALGEVKEASAVEPLITALKDNDLWVRWFSARALGEIKDAKAIEPLIGLLNEEDQRITSRAAESLAAITGENFGPDSSKWQEWCTIKKAEEK